jgi:hypothetical protein
MECDFTLHLTDIVVVKLKIECKLACEDVVSESKKILLW